MALSKSVPINWVRPMLETSLAAPSNLTHRIKRPKDASNENGPDERKRKKRKQTKRPRVRKTKAQLYEEPFEDFSGQEPALQAQTVRPNAALWKLVLLQLSFKELKEIALVSKEWLRISYSIFTSIAVVDHATPSLVLPMIRSRMPNLKILSLEGSSIKKKELNLLPKQLTSLNLTLCIALKGGGMKYLPENLVHLTLDNSPITDYALSQIPRTVRYLSACNCPRVTSVGLKSLPPNLKVFLLKNSTKITDLGAGEMPDTIETLSLNGCHGVTDGLIPKLPSSLRKLDIGGTRITTFGRRSLPSQVEICDLVENKIALFSEALIESESHKIKPDGSYGLRLNPKKKKEASEVPKKKKKAVQQPQPIVPKYPPFFCTNDLSKSKFTNSGDWIRLQFYFSNNNTCDVDLIKQGVLPNETIYQAAAPVVDSLVGKAGVRWCIRICEDYLDSSNTLEEVCSQYCQHSPSVLHAHNFVVEFASQESGEDAEHTSPIHFRPMEYQMEDSALDWSFDSIFNLE